MLKYLEHVHHLVDCYMAHKTKAVLEKACDLSIQLIFVPANGTGKYQPLDRKIFGILKAKLRALTESQILSGKERFDIIFNNLVKAWSEITIIYLMRALDISGLES